LCRPSLEQDLRGANIPVSTRFNMSVSLLKDDKIPAILDSRDVENYIGDEQAGYIFDEYARNEKTFIACHDVAREGLQKSAQ
jgi:hypothetical protein